MLKAVEMERSINPALLWQDHDTNFFSICREAGGYGLSTAAREQPAGEAGVQVAPPARPRHLLLTAEEPLRP